MEDYRKETRNKVRDGFGKRYIGIPLAIIWTALAVWVVVGYCI